jgi:hypothetical protein
MENTHHTGEYYADLDEETGLYCVFHTEKGGHAFESYCDIGEAEQRAKIRNEERATRRARFQPEPNDDFELIAVTVDGRSWLSRDRLLCGRPRRQRNVWCVRLGVTDDGLAVGGCCIFQDESDARENFARISPRPPPPIFDPITGERR